MYHSESSFCPGVGLLFPQLQIKATKNNNSKHLLFIIDLLLFRAFSYIQGLGKYVLSYLWEVPEYRIQEIYL